MLYKTRDEKITDVFYRLKRTVKSDDSQREA